MVLGVKYSVCLILLLSAGLCHAQEQDKVLQHLDSIANPIVFKQDLKFDTEHIDMGEFPDTLCPSFEFSFVNDGKETIIIDKITGSCSCLTVNCDKRTILPEEKGKVSVSYNPRGHVGKMHHQVFVYTNRSASHPASKLQLSGIVTSTIRYPGYNTCMGSLRLKRKSVNFGVVSRSDRNRIERIACVNDGSDTLSVSASFPVCNWLEIYTEPRSLPPGGEGDLVVSLDGDKIPDEMRDVRNFKVFLKGINSKLTDRQLDIIMILSD